MIESGPEALGGETAADGAVLAEEVEREVAQDGEVVRAIPAAHYQPTYCRRCYQGRDVTWSLRGNYVVGNLRRRTSTSAKYFVSS